MFGLYYYQEQRPVSLPLLDVSAEASIKELAAQVKLTQTYDNDAAFPIEARYSFPIPARAAVCSFVMIKRDGTRVVGVVQEKQEAKETYSKAVAQGQQASLMEQQTPDVFQVSVGNIPSKEQVKIELVYATELSEDEENDSVRFHLPMHIGVRYGQAPASLNTSSSKSPFLKVAMSVEAVSPIAKIGSPSHTVSTELGPDPSLPDFKELPLPNYARVSLSSDSALDKDFVLTIKSAGLDAPRCVAELHPSPSHDTVALALSFVPRFKLPDVARQEFIFLVDRSGSMEGDRIAAARKALVVMLRSLPHKDSLYQIVSFGSGSRALWTDGSRPYNQETLEEATRHVDAMHADFGGTEIRNALETCFAGRKRDRQTSVLVLTDGDAWDLDAVLATVKAAVATAPEHAPLRVSVLGIGDAVSTAMCEGIARVGNGTCMLVGEKESSFTGKIARLLKASRTPTISNISVDWGRPLAETVPPSKPEPADDFEMVNEVDATQTKKTLNVFDETVDPTHVDETPAPAAPGVVLAPPQAVQQSPFKIRNLVPGVRLNVYAILQGQGIPKTVTLRGSTAEGAEIELVIAVTLSHLRNAPNAPSAIHALAARKLIQDLEDGQHGLATTNSDDRDLLTRTVKASIVRLGKMYSISSTHTSFVAVDESAPKSQAPPVPDYQVVGQAEKAPFSRVKMKALHSVRPASASAPGGLPPPPVFSAVPEELGLVAGYSMEEEACIEDDESDDDMGFSSDEHFSPAAKAAPMMGGGGFDDYDFDVGFLAVPAESDDVSFEEPSSPLAAMAAPMMEGGGFYDLDVSVPPAEPMAAPTWDALETLARLQSFDGCFAAAPAVFALVKLKPGHDLQEVRALFPAGVADAVVATVLAMAFMSTKLGADADRDEWEGMHVKAEEYVREALDGTAGFTGSVESLEAEVVKMLA